MATKSQEGSLLEAQRAKATPPKMYKVLLLNDDYTPMEFVIAVLQRFFAMDTEQAISLDQISLQVDSPLHFPFVIVNA